MARRRAAVGATLVAIALPACWFMPREAGERMQADLAALRAEVARLSHAQEQAAAQQAEDRAQELASLMALRTNVDAWSQSARRTDADMGSQMEQMLADVQQLRGAIEVNEHRLSETESRLQQELATRLASLRQSTMKEERDASSTAVKNAAPKKKAELLPYGLKLVRSGKKVDGRGVLRDIVRRYGKERGLADEALFALGSLAFDERQYDAALRDFVRLVDGFGKSPRVAEAYYKIGACSEALGRLDDARTFYAEVQSSHGATPWANKARLRLAALSQPSAGERRSFPSKTSGEATGGADGNGIEGASRAIPSESKAAATKPLKQDAADRPTGSEPAP